MGWRAAALWAGIGAAASAGALARAMGQRERANAERHRALFDGVPVGLYRTTPDGRILEANAALAAMLGYQDASALLARAVADIVVDPADRAAEQALLEQNGVVTAFELELRRSDGASIWVEDSLRPVRDAGGRVTSYEGSVRDVTTLKRALRTRDEFLSQAAHDLKNPLTAARAQSQLLRSWSLREDPPTPERVAQGFDRLDTSIMKMARLIDELRDVTNLQEARPLQLRSEPTDLVQLARQAVAEHALATRRHQPRLETELETLIGTWDPGRLDRVLANLLDNALKYSPNGGEIVVSVWRENECAALSVRDRGIGVPSADLPHIFNRYHRASNVVRRIVGSGIGLAGVRAIV